MNKKSLSKYFGIFVLATLIIIVYKTFDSLGIVFSYIGDFFSLLSPIFAAFAIAFVLYPACKRLEDLFNKHPKLKKHSRGLSVATIYLGALIVVGAFFAVMVPIIYNSISEFIKQLPSLVESAGKYLYSLKIGNYSLRPILDKLTVEEAMAKFDLNDVDTYVASIASISKSIVNIGLSVIISVYILLDRAGLLNTSRKIRNFILPEKWKIIFKKYAHQTFNIMYKYIYCQLLDMCIVAIIAFIGLTVMDVKYAPILAIFIGISNLIPYFGAIVACALASLLTVFTASVPKAIIVAVVLIILQQIDANIIQPRIVKNALKVKPFWVLCGVLVGGGLFGMLGIILAVPVMALIKVIANDVYDYHMSAVATSDSKKSEEDPGMDSSIQTNSEASNN